jgi:hypothetical protein
MRAVTYTVKGAGKAAQNLRGVNANLVDLSSAFEQIGGFYRKQVLAQFQEHGFVPGESGPWVPLSNNTVEKKDRNKLSPLMEYKELQRSLTVTDARFNIAEIDMHKAKFGTNDPVAIFHQGGTDNGGKLHVPERPIVLGNKILDVYIAFAISKQLFRWWRM